MSTNCLVTQLKSTIDNDSLKKLGAFYLTYRAGNDSPTTIVKENPEVQNIYCKILNPTENTEFLSGIIDGEKTEGYLATNTQYSTYVIKTEEGTRVEISNKYPITTLILGTSYYPYVKVNTEDLKGLTKLTRLQMCNFAEAAVPDRDFGLIGNIKDLAEMPLTDLRTSFNNGIKGSVDALAGKQFSKVILGVCTNITGAFSSLISPALQEVCVYATNITGDLDDLYNGDTLICPNISSIDIRYNSMTVKRSTLNKLSRDNVATVLYSQTVIEDV